MTNREVAEQVADLIHASFRRGAAVLPGIPGITEASQLSGSIRSELLYCAAQLKREDLDAEVLSKVDANIRTAQVSGIVTTDAYDQIQDLLAQISDVSNN